MKHFSTTLTSTHLELALDFTDGEIFIIESRYYLKLAYALLKIIFQEKTHLYVGTGAFWNMWNGENYEVVFTRFTDGRTFGLTNAQALSLATLLLSEVAQNPKEYDESRFYGDFVDDI